MQLCSLELLSFDSLDRRNCFILYGFLCSGSDRNHLLLHAAAFLAHHGPQALKIRLFSTRIRGTHDNARDNFGAE